MQVVDKARAARLQRREHASTTAIITTAAAAEHSTQVIQVTQVVYVKGLQTLAYTHSCNSKTQEGCA
eukprot:20520-Heterococcus_DN1.PRE.5